MLIPQSSQFVTFNFNNGAIQFSGMVKTIPVDMSQSFGAAAILQPVDRTYTG